MRPLKTALQELGVDVTGWTLTSAQAISTDGNTITGYGRAPGSSNVVAFVAVIPEPGHVAGLASSLAALALLGRRRAAGKSRRSPV